MGKQLDDYLSSLENVNVDQSSAQHKVNSLMEIRSEFEDLLLWQNCVWLFESETLNIWVTSEEEFEKIFKVIEDYFADIDFVGKLLGKTNCDQLGDCLSYTVNIKVTSSEDN